MRKVREDTAIQGRNGAGMLSAVVRIGQERWRGIDATADAVGAPYIVAGLGCLGPRKQRALLTMAAHAVIDYMAPVRFELDRNY